MTDPESLIFYTHHRGYDPALQRSRLGLAEVEERRQAWEGLDLPPAERERRWGQVFSRQAADLGDWHPEPGAAEAAVRPGLPGPAEVRALGPTDLPSADDLATFCAGLGGEGHPVEQAAAAFSGWVRLVPMDFRGGWMIATRVLVTHGYPPPVPDPAEAARLPDLAETAGRGESAPVSRALSLSLCRALEALLIG